MNKSTNDMYLADNFKILLYYISKISARFSSSVYGSVQNQIQIVVFKS